MQRKDINVKQSICLSLLASTLALAGGSSALVACRSDHGSQHARGEAREKGEEDEADEENEEAGQEKMEAHEKHGEKHEHHAKKGRAEEDEEGGREDVITLAQAPDAVRNALAKMSAMSDVKKVERITQDEAVSFEIGFESDGAKSSVTMSDRGDTLELETPAGELPRAVTDAIGQEMKGAKILHAEAVQLSFYEVVVERDGKKHEVKVFANGHIEGRAKNAEKD